MTLDQAYQSVLDRSAARKRLRAKGVPAASLMEACEVAAGWCRGEEAAIAAARPFGSLEGYLNAAMAAEKERNQ